MKITALHVHNFKRLRELEVKPDSDRVLLLVGGKNAQGKSSLLDALTAAFGGKTALPKDPVRHGADEAEIRVELDGGAIVVRRTVKPDGTSLLEVREDGGRVRSPQARLDELIGKRFLDPLAFLSLSPGDQRAALLTIVAEADRLAELDRKRIRAFDKRTELGRDLRRAEGELARLPDVTPATPIDVVALSEEARQLEDAQRAQQAATARHDAARTNREAAARKVEGLRAQLAQAERELAESVDREERARVEAEQAAGPAGADARRDEIMAELRRAQEHNRRVAADEAAARRRVEASAEVDQLREQVQQCTDAIATIDTRKAEILAAAALPVPGLSVDDQGVTLDGVPLAQASGAERLRVALGLAIAASPGLRDVWIRDGALLDDDSLALVAEHAEAAGVRVWVERVGDRDPGAILIHDGGVLGGAAKE